MRTATSCLLVAVALGLIACTEQSEPVGYLEYPATEPTTNAAPEAPERPAARPPTPPPRPTMGAHRRLSLRPADP